MVTPLQHSASSAGRDIRVDPPEVGSITREITPRLHGEACARCGTTEGLRDGGWAHTPIRDGGVLGWRVKVCRNCPERV
jgi:hypothetical protein